MLTPVSRLEEADRAASAAAPASARTSTTRFTRGTGSAAGAGRGRHARPEAGDGGIHHVRIARRDRQIRLKYGRQARSQLSPRRPTVGRLENAAIVRLRVPAESATLDVALLLLPERRVDDVGIRGIDAHVVTA